MKRLFIISFLFILANGCNNYNEDSLFSIPKNLSPKTLKKLGYVNNIDYPYYRKKIGDTVIIYEADSLNKFTDKAIFIKSKRLNDSIYLADFFHKYKIRIISCFDYTGEHYKFYARNIERNFIMEVMGNHKSIVIRIPIVR